ncbi:Hypothetical protein, putative [Bodo saltans]|uniref:Uncharacterized protein n=1 Tax=Bodo saltans TaxID=75058 RepID=A0A0S4IW64_BODSA|nr:Hypothetical protein, putative [Bodo saltans]|eukprot:CUF96515.1 Hypothetical protein, putative [Bodo saltans]
MQGQPRPLASEPTTGLAKPRQERLLTFNPTGSYDKLPAIDGTSQHYTSSSKTRFNSSCMPLLNE